MHGSSVPSCIPARQLDVATFARRPSVRSRFVVITLLVLGLLAVRPGRAQAELVVGRLVVHGANKSRVAALAARMRLAPGDRVDFEGLAEAEQRLVESNLFSSAHVFVDLPRAEAARLMYASDEKIAVDVQVDVVEKLSWFLVPMATFGSGDYAGGLVYGEQNLFGHDMQLLAAGQLGLSTSYGFIALRDPQIAGLALTYDVSGIFRMEQIRFFSEHRLVLQVPTTLAGGQAEVGWVLSPHLRAYLGFSARRQWVDPGVRSSPDVTPPSYNPRSGDIFLLVFQVLFDNSTAPEGLRRGVRLVLKNEVSDRYWGSDFDYTKPEARVELFGHWGRHYPSLVLDAVLDYPTSERGVPITEMLRIGGPGLRGYLVNEFHGDTLFGVQIEDQILLWRNLHVPWTHTTCNLAGAAFADFAALLERHPGGTTTGALTDPPPPVRPMASDFHPSVGVGARIILPGVAIPALKLDVGYGIDVSAFAFTVSIGGGSF